MAGACIHDNWPKEFLLPTEARLRSSRDDNDDGNEGASSSVPSESLLQILHGMSADPVVSSAVKDSTAFNKIRDGLLKRTSAAELVPHLSRFQVRPTPRDLERKLSEMMHTCIYTMGAAQRPGKEVTLDFVLLHSVTLCVFYPAILALDWLTDAEKARILEAKGRVDAVMYAGCGCPELYPDRIRAYVARRPGDGWPELFGRAVVYRDEGHVAKAIRALYCLERLDLDGIDVPISKVEFRKIAHMTVDSVERAMETDGTTMSETVSRQIEKQVGVGGDMVVNNLIRWVFYGGIDKAWQYVPDTARNGVEV